MTAPAPETSAAEARRAEPGRILIFTVEGQEYGLPLEPVVEIVRHRSATPVPYAAPEIEGIVPLRGRMVTLLDVRRFLGRPPRPAAARAQVIVIDSSGDLLGLVVDAVTRVAVLPAGAPEPLPPGLRLARPGLLGGVLRKNDEYVVLLDLDAILKGLS
jgi:purine-binding chemotaxis protein CheW